MISILDYGMGNLASIRNMLKKVGAPSKIISTAKEVDQAQALIIPGVGKFDSAMSQIGSMDLQTSMDNAALVRKIPILGICLGMQLMTQGSEEGKLPGLSWVKARCRLIEGGKVNVRIPHMGWNLIKIRKPNPYFDTNMDQYRFYFVHSYAVQCDEVNDVLTTTAYGQEFVSSFAIDNLVGVQFHPEKSHKYGSSFLRGYVNAFGLLDN